MLNPMIIILILILAVAILIIYIKVLLVKLHRLDDELAIGKAVLIMKNKEIQRLREAMLLNATH